MCLSGRAAARSGGCCGMAESLRGTVCSTSCGRTRQKIRRAVSANLGESKGAAHGPLSSFQMGGFRGKKSKSSQGRTAWETYGFAAWRQNCLHRQSRCMCETAARRRRQTLCLARRRNNGIRACSGFCGVCFPAPPGLKRLFGFFHLCVCTFSASRA